MVARIGIDPEFIPVAEEHRGVDPEVLADIGYSVGTESTADVGQPSDQGSDNQPTVTSLDDPIDDLSEEDRKKLVARHPSGEGIEESAPPELRLVANQMLPPVDDAPMHSDDDYHSHSGDDSDIEQSDQYDPARPNTDFDSEGGPQRHDHSDLDIGREDDHPDDNHPPFDPNEYFHHPTVREIGKRGVAAAKLVVEEGKRRHSLTEGTD